MKLQGRTHITFGRRSKFENRIEYGDQILHGDGKVPGGETLFRRGIDHREIELLIVGVEFHQQVEDLIQDLLASRLGTIDLVHHENRPQPMLQGLAQNEARLGHHPFDGIDQEQDRIHHAQDTLHLASEICMPRGIDELDSDAFVLDGGALGLDRDSPLALQIARIHHAILDHLVGFECATGLQQAVDERRLTVVDMRHDREVAQIGSEFGIRHEGWA